MLTHLDLFSGIGGFALACEWAGIETIGFVEIDKYCQKVLRKHWPNVPIVEDIRDVEKIKEIVANSQETKCQQPGATRTGWTRLTNGGRNGKSNHPGGAKLPAILITAGFPCQPFSVAGKRGGKEDNRYLWPETIDVIEAIKPKWVLLENVTGIINLALDTVLSDLEGAGYSYETLIIPACAVNAWHRRDRVWIVAQNSDNSIDGGTQTSRHEAINRNVIPAGGIRVIADTRLLGQAKRQVQTAGIEQCSEDAADTQREGLEGPDTEGSLCRTGQPSEYGQGERQADWWAVEPELGRVAHGIPNRVDRLKCLGNAIVPQVAYEILKGIAEIEIAGDDNG